MLTFENIWQAVLASVRRASMTIRVWGVHMSMCMVYICTRYIYIIQTHFYLYHIYIHTLVIRR
jgi:hypothetical protein